jgi:mycothiol synthase
MATEMMQGDTLVVSDAPDIPGLRFRRFRGEADFPEMARVAQAGKAADKIEELETVQMLTRRFANLTNSDPYKDMVMAEVNGELVGFRRGEWWHELEGTYIYGHYGHLAPEWRGKGLEQAMLHFVEERMRQVAEQHPADAPKMFDTYATNTQTGMRQLLSQEGYEAIREAYEMATPDLDNIPDIPMPQGLETRLVKPEHYRVIWEAEVEAFKDHWGEAEVEEGDYERWLNSNFFQPHLWQVGWDGDQVAGMVRNFIHEDENAYFNRKRGYTENISVRRPWRRLGLARALIARSFKMHKELGMTEAALGVDALNPNGALQLYESMGFRPIITYIIYRKPLEKS